MLNCDRPVGSITLGVPRGRMPQPARSHAAACNAEWRRTVRHAELLLLQFGAAIWKLLHSSVPSQTLQLTISHFTRPKGVLANNSRPSKRHCDELCCADVQCECRHRPFKRSIYKSGQHAQHLHSWLLSVQWSIHFQLLHCLRGVGGQRSGQHQQPRVQRCVELSRQFQSLESPSLSDNGRLYEQVVICMRRALVSCALASCRCREHLFQDVHCGGPPHCPDLGQHAARQQGGSRPDALEHDWRLQKHDREGAQGLRSAIWPLAEGARLLLLTSERNRGECDHPMQRLRANAMIECRCIGAPECNPRGQSMQLRMQPRSHTPSKLARTWRNNPQMPGRMQLMHYSCCVQSAARALARVCPHNALGPAGWAASCALQAAAAHQMQWHPRADATLRWHCIGAALHCIRLCFFWKLAIHQNTQPER